MRKLKLQMQLSLDGFATLGDGGTNFNWNDEVRIFSIENLTNVDNILPGRNTANDFILYWVKVAGGPTNNDYKFGKLLTDIPKIVFANKLKTNKWTMRLLQKATLQKK